MKGERLGLAATLILAAGLLTTAAGGKASSPAGVSGPARIPVEVRVFDGHAFVGDLSLKDFEVEEAGMSAVPEALFLIRRGKVERREGAADVIPNLTRKLALLFQLNEYPAKIAEALDYLFREGLIPGDSLEIQTPMKNYQLSPQGLAAKPRPVLARELTKLIRRDVVQGGMAYNSLLRQLKAVVRLIGQGNRTVGDTEGEFDANLSLELMLMHYREDLQKMQELRVLNENAMVAFAGRLRDRPGQKFVYYFYQREFRPEISPQVLDMLVMGNQDQPQILAEAQTLFQMYHHSITLNHARLRQAFADSMANVNFLFLQKEPDRSPNITMREQSEDIFRAISAISEATGGLVDTSQNPAASVKAAVAASESYYLLYFTPSATGPPGTFLDLEVKVRGRDLKVLHPIGYYSRS